MDDPLELLGPTRGAGEALRQRLFERTLREVRRQRRRRRLQSLAALATAFAAGFFTLAALLPVPPAGPQRSLSLQTVESPVEPVEPADLEWQALDRPTEAPALYRQAGDDYLRRGGYADALRCYGNALDEARPGALEVTGNDSWLLIAIKHARKKEMDQCAHE
jgi:hypothetical protein